MLPSDVEVGPNRDIQIETEAIDGGPIEEVVRPHLDGGPSGGSGQRLTLTCPSTGAHLATVACAGPEDMHHAVDSAARCWKLWRGTPFRERGRRLRRLAALVHEQRNEIARLISREQGKPRLEALTLEVIPALDHLRFIIRHAERYQAGLAVEPRHPFYAHKRAHYLYDPIGVAAIVTPSSLPFAIPLIQVATALAMGNAVVLKPSERTPLCGLRVGALCTEAGFPAGLVNVMPAVPENTMHLVLHAKVDKVFVTGSLEVGQNIMAMAGCAVRPVVLSLGCNHASIVAGEADVKRAARGIVWGALANAGQNCGSVQRVFVVERVASKHRRQAPPHRAPGPRQLVFEIWRSSGRGCLGYSATRSPDHEPGDHGDDPCHHQADEDRFHECSRVRSPRRTSAWPRPSTTRPAPW